MPKPRYRLGTRQYHCHPETCGHDEHKLWWLWYIAGAYYDEGFDTKEEAIEFCKKYGYTYVVEQGH